MIITTQTTVCDRCKKDSKEVSFNNKIEISNIIEYIDNKPTKYDSQKKHLCNSCAIMYNDFMGGQTDL